MTSTMFNNFGNSSEQELLEDLVIESIHLMGQEMYYLPRRRINFDQVYYQDDQSVFDTAYLIDIFVNSTQGFQGQGAFLSKFGYEIRDEALFSIARRTFSIDVTRHDPDLLRPREGDLIYFPLNNKCFQISYVNDKPFFYQLGDLQVYEVTVQLFEYSNEKFTTGIEAIDRLQLIASFDGYDYSIQSQDGYTLVSQNGDIIADAEYTNVIQNTDPTSDNLDIDQELEYDDIIDWSEDNPFAEGRY